MHLARKEHYPFLVFITLVAAIRLLLAPHVGLGVDEAHYVLYALHLDLSYFDHPPLVGWVQFLFTSVFGTGEFGARVAAILIGFIVSIFLYKLTYEINHKAKEAFFAVLALHGAFMFNALFVMLMPDTLLFLFIIPIIFSVLGVEKSGSIKSWLLLGLLLGLAGLSKYTAVLFVPPIILYLLFKKRYDLFCSPKLLLAIGLALIVVSPVIIWNMQNDWLSFTYQSQHVVGAKHIVWKGFFKSITSQFFAYNPFLMPIAFYGLYKSFRSKNDLLLLSAFFGLVLILFFTYASLYKTALPHWSALFYLLFIPIGAVYFLQVSKKFIVFAVGIGLLIGAFAYIELGFKIITFPKYKSIHRDIYGFDTIMKKANAEIKDPKKEVLGVTNWTFASRAIYYDRNYPSKVYLIDKRYDQFDLWEKSMPIGKDVIFINTHFFHKDIAKTMQCNSVRKLSSFDLKINGSIENSIEFVLCSNFQGMK